MMRKIIRPLRLFSEKVVTKLNDFLANLVIRLRWFWLVILSAIAIGGCVVVFRYPGLRVPDSQSFQLFDESHLFETYDLVYSKKFWFERKEMVRIFIGKNT